MSKQKKSVTSEELLNDLEKVATKHGVDTFMFVGINSDPSIVFTSKVKRGTALEAIERANLNLLKNLNHLQK